MAGRSERRAARVRVFLGDPAVTEERAHAALSELISSDRKDLDLEIVRLPDDPIEPLLEADAAAG